MFADVDEYLYPAKLVNHSSNARDDEVLRASSRTLLRRFLQSEVKDEELRYQLKAASQPADSTHQSGCTRVGQVSVPCLVFGPSGHRLPPQAGMSAGYTCRLRHSKRHKVFVLADALVPPMVSVVHDFESLKKGFCTQRLCLDTSAFFHYKFLAWDDFKDKFHRRAGKEGPEEVALLLSLSVLPVTSSHVLCILECIFLHRPCFLIPSHSLRTVGVFCSIIRC